MVAGRTGPGHMATSAEGPTPAAPVATQRLHALARVLLERHGIVTREAVMAEGVEGGFAAIYPGASVRSRNSGRDPARLLRGRARGGPVRARGAIDRLRAGRDGEGGAPRVDLLAAA